MTLLYPVEKGRPGAARVEYRACKEDVEALLAKGYSTRMAWEAMTEQGRVQCSYSAFCDYVRGNGKRKHSPGPRTQQTQLRTPVTALQQSGPRIVRPESKQFTYSPSEVDPKTLF